MPTTPSEILIKRYGGRRLYNTDAMAYVTLSDLAKILMAGQRFTVRDADTSEDLTEVILAHLR